MITKLSDLKTEIMALLGAATSIAKVYDTYPKTFSEMTYPFAVLKWKSFEKNNEEAPAQSETSLWELSIFLDANDQTPNMLLQKIADIKADVETQIEANRHLNGKCFWFWLSTGGAIMDEDYDVARYVFELVVKQY